jgi:hypothetical protein
LAFGKLHGPECIGHISFPRKIYAIHSIKLMSFKFGMENVKDFDVILESKLYFSQHINYKPSQALELICFVRNNSSFDVLKILHVSLIKSKLQCTSAAWKSLTLRESSTLKNILSRLICDYRRGFD